MANAEAKAFADLAVLTVGLLILATTFRLGADKIFIGEVQAAYDERGAAGARKRGADLIAFAVLSSLVGGTLVAVGPLADILENALSAPLSQAEHAMVGLWLMSEVARLVVSEGHRSSFQLGRAVFAGTGARSPIFLGLILYNIAFQDGLTRERLIFAAGTASFTVFVISLLGLFRLFPWWAANPLRNGAQLWIGHSTMLATTLGAAIIGAADIWIVGATMGSDPAARYALSVTLVAGIAIVSTAISVGLSPYLAAGLQPGNRKKTSALLVTYTRAAGLLAALIYFAVISLAEPLAVRIGGTAYDGILPLVVILGAGQLAGVLAGPGGTALIIGRQYRLIASITVGVACAMLISTTVFALLTHDERLVALASASATGFLHAISAVMGRRRLGVTVHAFHRVRRSEVA